MKKQVNKDNLIPDIVLSVAIIISMIISSCLMYLIQIKYGSFKMAIFFVIFFILIKVWYNGIMHIVRRKRKQK